MLKVDIRKAVFLFVLAWAAIIYSWMVWNVREIERSADERMAAIEAQQAVAVATYAEPAPDETDKPPKMQYIGQFKISFYTADPSENGGYAGLTSAGTRIDPGTTAATAIGELEYGSVIYIQDVGFRTIQDTGCNLGTIDVAVASKDEAFELGVFTSDVWICEVE